MKVKGMTRNMSMMRSHCVDSIGIILMTMLMCDKVIQKFDRQQPSYSVKIKGKYIEKRSET